MSTTKTIIEPGTVPTHSLNSVNETHMMHGQNWRGEDVAGWIATEKYDGCRAYWDGRRLWSRGGDEIKAPESLTRGLPAGLHMDCEVFCGPGVQGHNAAVAAVRYGKFPPNAELVVFDCPSVSGGYRARLNEATKLILCGRYKNPQHRVPVGVEVQGSRQVMDLFREVTARGGEGLVLWNPTAWHRAGRTHNVLKVKE